jgi:AraC family L-rhamnose operon transcriptional activator RhaR
MSDETPQLLASRQLFAQSAVRIHVNRPIHEGDTPLHCHDFLEIAVVVSGRAVHRTIAGLKPVNGGEVFVISPGQWHAFERCRELRTYNCVVGMDLIQRELAWTLTDNSLARLVGRTRNQHDILAIKLENQHLQLCLDYLERLRGIQNGKHPCIRPIQLGYILVLLGELASHRSASQGADDTELAHPAITKAMELMAGDLAREWSITALAEQLDLNASYFSRCFTRCTGLSPMNWLIRQRAEQAAILLLTSKRPIAEVGHAVGWHDANYFSRRFRAIFGQSPKDYRKQLPTPPLPQAPADWIQW